MESKLNTSQYFIDEEIFYQTYKNESDYGLNYKINFNNKIIKKINNILQIIQNINLDFEEQPNDIKKEIKEYIDIELEFLKVDGQSILTLLKDENQKLSEIFKQNITLNFSDQFFLLLLHLI